MRIPWVALALALVVAAAAPESAEACTCASPLPYEEASAVRASGREAVSVFVGRVISLATTEGPSNGGDPPIMHSVAAFEVLRSWKPQRHERVEVHFRWGSGQVGCDYAFRQGSEYLVFSYGVEQAASTCGFTRLVTEKDAQRFEAHLGKPVWKRED